MPELRSAWAVFAGLTRLRIIGISVALPLSGALTSTGTALRSWLLVASIGAIFHVTAAITNDVNDLTIDRTDPRRRDSPLVRGLVSPRAGLVGALLCIPLAFAIDLIVAPPTATRTLLLVGSYVGVVSYNLWAKRSNFGPLMDLTQAVGWAMFVLYGATAVGGTPSNAYLVAAATVPFVLLTSGVHGALRDISNDTAHGRHTTPTFFGSYTRGDVVIIPNALRAYSWSLLAAVIALSAAAGPGVFSVVAAGWSIAVMHLLLRNRSLRVGDVRSLAALHVIGIFAAVCSIVASQHGSLRAANLVVVFIAPTLISEITARRQPVPA